MKADVRCPAFHQDNPASDNYLPQGAPRLPPRLPPLAPDDQKEEAKERCCTEFVRDRADSQARLLQEVPREYKLVGPGCLRWQLTRIQHPSQQWGRQSLPLPSQNPHPVQLHQPHPTPPPSPPSHDGLRRRKRPLQHPNLRFLLRRARSKRSPPHRPVRGSLEASPAGLLCQGRKRQRESSLSFRGHRGHISD